jgi:hypothetical protein
MQFVRLGMQPARPRWKERCILQKYQAIFKKNISCNCYTVCLRENQTNQQESNLLKTILETAYSFASDGRVGVAAGVKWAVVAAAVPIRTA